ncbi:MAG: hypothetical protein ACLUKN_02230 [Bacilli bacterium]
MHGSFLPSYRGRAPLNWSIINGENCCGASLHVLEKFDLSNCSARKSGIRGRRIRRRNNHAWPQQQCVCLNPPCPQSFQQSTPNAARRI